MKFVALILLFFGSPAWACIETPKAITLSETTYEKDLEITYGTNCRVNLELKSTSNTTYGISNQTDKGGLCLTIIKDQDYKHKKEYCGEDLQKLVKENKEVLTLRNKAGKAIGFLNMTDDQFQIQSWRGGGITNKPYLEFKIIHPEKVWNLIAMENQDTQIGGGKLESTACTRGISKEIGNDNIVDVRGKSISTSGAGCASGLEVTDCEVNRKPVATKPAFNMQK